MIQLPKVLVVGNVAKDIYLSRMKGLDLFYEGHTPYSKFKVGDLIEASELYVSSGGGAFNIVAALSKWGFETAIASLLGNDSMASQIQTDLNRLNVDTKLIQTSDSDCTAINVHLYDRGMSNQHTVVAYQPKWRSFNFQNMRIKDSGASWMYVSSVDGQFDLLDNLFSQAKRDGQKILFNPGMSELTNIKKCYGLFEDTDILLVNREEAALFTQDNILDSSVQKLSNFVDLAIITDAEDGVIVSNGSSIWRAGPYQVTSIVDRNGVGDAFGAGFLANYLATGEIDAAIRFASANAASVLAKMGSVAGLIDFDAEINEIPVRERSNL